MCAGVGGQRSRTVGKAHTGHPKRRGTALAVEGLSYIDTQQSSRHGLRRSPFAVPDKIFGLTHFLDFIDRGTHYTLAVSATGSARACGPPLQGGLSRSQ